MDQYQAAKEDIKGASDIVELIGQFVQLKRAGQNYLGLCPFHSEKAPSFTVSPSKQMFHCFGCKKGGDIFAFWMAYHKVTFPQAFKDLADRYHIQLPQKPLTKSEKRQRELKDLLFDINQKAAQYFHSILTESENGERGRNYFSKRSIPGDIISEYILGYAPDGWDGLVRFFRGQGMDPEKVVQAGLFIPKKSGGYYDRFRNRVIFPIFDVRGKIVGFGARVLDDSLPKYLNTPETPIFRKGELLYGLQTASRTIRNSDRAVVVEGYTDVLGLKTHGFQEAVATLGTSLTSHHVRTLKGYAQETVVVFDSDAAGEKAALKSLSLFLREGLASRVMILPEGEDPDSFVRKHGLERFLQLLDHAAPMFEYYLDRKIAGGHPGVEGKVKVLREILPLLSTLNDRTQQALYTRRLSEKLDVAESVVLAEIRRLPNQRGTELDKDRLGDRVMSTKVKDIDGLHLINLFIHYPHTMKRLMNHDCRLLLPDPDMVELCEMLNQIYLNEGEIPPENILERLKERGAQERFREVLIAPPIYSDEEVEQAVIEFENRIHKLEISASFHNAVKRGDLEKLNQLLKQKSNQHA